jgi:hypothetical protein
MTLALLISLVSLAAAAYYCNWSRFTVWNKPTLDSLVTFLGPAGLRHGAWAIAGFIIAVLAYFQAAAHALAWGDLVKSAFDCYLPALIKQLGFVLPVSNSERREFWKEFNRLIFFQIPMTANRWPLASEPAPLPEPAKPGLEQSGQEENNQEE